MPDNTAEQPVLTSATLQTSGALLAAQTALSRVIARDAVAQTGQDATVVDLLVRLDQAPGNRLRAVDLSRELVMSPSHISRMLDRAEEAGLVARSADPNDRRASQVALTDGGREVLKVFSPHFEAVITRVIDQTLTAGEAATLRELLHRIASAADAERDVGAG